MKVISLILALSIFVYCNRNKENKQLSGLVKGSESPIKYDKVESKVKIKKNIVDFIVETYTYEKYVITIASDRYCDSVQVDILNRKSKKEIRIHESPGCEYFQGIYGNIAIWDEGTGIARSTILMDLDNGREIFEIGTNGNLRISENRIYMDILDIPKEQLIGKKRPYCKDTVPCDGCGEIAEVIYYDCQMHKIVHTGEIKCAY